MEKGRKIESKPESVLSAGQMLKQTLELLGLSQAELAERTGRPKKTINEIIQGKAIITPETALQLELVLGISASHWLTCEAHYRAWQARKEADVRIEKDVAFLNELPVKEMVKYGWIRHEKDKREQVKALLSFFGVVSSDKIPLVEQTAFRRSQAFASNPWALAAWLRKGELDAQEIECGYYDSEAFMRCLMQVRKLTTESPKTFVSKLRKLNALAGVAVTFVRELPNTSVSGATRWLSPSRALIQLSLRHKTDDMIWFAYFHEAAHVYLEHAKREVLLESQFGPSLDHRETQANSFAMSLLIPSKDFNAFVERDNFSEEAICYFAERLGIAPGIIVGRLQHEGRLAWTQHRALKKTFSWEIWPSN